MTTPLYVRSTDGADGDAGTSWALAKATFQTGVLGADEAGGVVYVSSTHSETPASAMTLTTAGTLASPMKILSVNDGAEPPTALAAGAIIGTTSANSVQLNGCNYWHGITFKAASSTLLGSISIGVTDASHNVLENCTLQIVGTDTSARIAFGTATATNETSAILKNCVLQFAHIGQGISVGREHRLHMQGGSTAGSALTTFVQTEAQGGVCIFDGVDLSSLATGVNLLNASTSGVASGAMTIYFRNCKLPANWSGSLFSGDLDTMALRAEMHNCSASDTNYTMWVEDYSGSIKHETSVTRQDGATDGTTPISWKMVTNSTSSFPTVYLQSPEIFIKNVLTTGTLYITAHVATNNVTLDSSEAWIEVMALGTSGYPLGGWYSDRETNILTGLGGNSADQDTDGNSTWNNVPGTPVKQELTASFDPKEVGYIVARVCLAKPSTTMYVCPKLTVT